MREEREEQREKKKKKKENANRVFISIPKKIQRGSKKDETSERVLERGLIQPTGRVAKRIPQLLVTSLC